MSRNRIHILLTLILAFALASCTHRERFEPEPGGTSHNPHEGKIAFSVGSAASVSPLTKGSDSYHPSRSFLGLVGEDSLFVTATVSDNTDPVVSPEVKGALVTTDNLTDFYVSAYFTPDPDPGLKYFDLAHMTADDRTDEGIYPLDYYWPQASLDFFASNFEPLIKGAGSLDSMTEVGADPLWNTTKSTSPQENFHFFGYDAEYNCQGQFAYALPAPDPEQRNDALSQPDYVLAISEGRTSDEGVVPLNFAHCFSAVTFKLGSEFMNDQGRIVDEIRVKGVAPAGVCTYSLDAENMMFNWEVQGADKETYCQKIGRAVNNGEVINSGDITFMLIPHTISADAELELVFTLHDESHSLDGAVDHEHTYIVSVNLSELTSAWEPGKKYTYAISGEETVQVEVTDEFISTEPLVKGNLQITNQGTAVTYVRAAIVGWWENADGNVVAPWLEETQGIFSGKGWGEGRTWFKGEDGFYYYMLPLWPGLSTDKLFDTYTLTANPPTPDSRLILNIATQAVLHYRVEEAWPLRTSGIAVNGFTVTPGTYW